MEGIGLGFLGYIKFIRILMEEQMLDINKIPKFEFEIHNDQLKNCIKQLHFQSKTQQKHIQKIKKQLQTCPTETNIVDSFKIINSNIDIDPVLLRQLPARKQNKQNETALNSAAHTLGNKIGQISDVLAILFEKTKMIEKQIDNNESSIKVIVNDKCMNLQGQLDQYKKMQNKETRTLNQDLQISINKYEEKLREVESKTLWQINDCKTKLEDRVNEQFVKDTVRQSQARFNTKLKQSLIKNNIDPERIDKLETRCLKMQKDLELKMVEATSRLNDLRDNIQHSLTSKKETANDKLDLEKKIGNLQIQAADALRKCKNLEIQLNGQKEDISKNADHQEEQVKQLGKISRLVANLKISDDFQKLMQNLDPHKICQIDTTLVNLAQRDLKIEKELDSMKRYQQKLKQKVQICNLLLPNDSKGKLDKEEINKIFIDLIAGNPTFKKIQTIEGQLYEFKAHGDLINDINKKIGKIQKEFDLQGVIYSLRGLEEYIKKQLLMMNTKVAMIESGLAEEKKRRPISARKTSDGKMTSSVSYKKLMPVDCISCFQNPMTSSPEQRRLFGNKH